MNILLEIADKDLIFIGLAFVGLIIFANIIFYIVNKDNKVRPISEDDRFDQDDEPKVSKLEEIKPVTTEQQEAKAELERVFNQMSADLEDKQPAPEVIEEFEREQEESAIISYQELIKQANDNKMATIKEPKKSEEVLANYLGETPVQSVKSITEEESTVELESKGKQKADELGEPEKQRKFKNSDIISPIFGIQSEEESQLPKAEANAPRHAYEEIKVAYESENNSDFLNSLKEFRNNL